MSYAPANLTALMAYLTTQGVVNLGIVGSATHTYGYHLGKDRIFAPGGQGANDYSVKLARDKAGLTNAARAVDLGRVGGSLAGLRQLTAWLWAECQEETADSRMIREVLGSADGTTVRCWIAREAGGPKLLPPGCADLSHLTHTHISFFRDTDAVDVRPLFRRYFEDTDMAPIPAADFAHIVNRKTTLAKQAPFYAAPSSAAAQYATYPAGTAFSPVNTAKAENVTWYGGFLFDNSPSGFVFGYFRQGTLNPLEPAELVGDAAKAAADVAAAAVETAKKYQ